MSKKIIILNGSPRKTGNTTALTAEFKKGAEEAGNIVTEFFLDTMNINGCKGCFGGGKNPDSPCAQKDDMDKIYPVYKEADIVVLATPLYYWTVSGQLKKFIAIWYNKDNPYLDRRYAIVATNKIFSSSCTL